MSTNPTTDAGNIAGTPSEYANKAAFQIMLNTESASQARNGPRFTFVEYQQEQAIEVQKAIDEALTQSREATAQAEREIVELFGGDISKLKSDRRLLNFLNGVKSVIDYLRPRLIETEAELATAKAELQEAQRQRDGRETDLMTALKDLATAKEELKKSEEKREEYRRISFNQHIDISNFKDALATETAKNARLQDYILKLDNLLGCKDDDDSPELGIKEMIADRAELREKLAKAENVMTMVVGHLNWPPHRAAVASAIAALRGNDKAEKGAGE